MLVFNFFRPISFISALFKPREISRNFDENEILETSMQPVHFFSRIEEEEDDYEPQVVVINQVGEEKEEEEEEEQLPEDTEMSDREPGITVNEVTDEEEISKIIRETHTIIGGHRGIHATVARGGRNGPGDAKNRGFAVVLHERRFAKKTSGDG